MTPQPPMHIHSKVTTLAFGPGYKLLPKWQQNFIDDVQEHWVEHDRELSERQAAVVERCWARYQALKHTL